MYFITEYFDPLIGFDIILDPESYLIRRIHRMIFCVRAISHGRQYQMIYPRSRLPPALSHITRDKCKFILNCNSRNLLAGNTSEYPVRRSTGIDLPVLMMTGQKDVMA